MKAKCITTIIDSPDFDLIKSGWWHVENYLTVGKEYVVYAVYSSCYCPGSDAFLVCDDNYNDNSYYWPVYIPACFFEITDNVRPDNWIVSQENPKYCGPAEIGPCYYESLVDGDAEVLAAFRRIKDSIPL